ncbi:MAG: enolase C-terminal domain-like protein [Bacteroidota bacterium]
MRINLIQLHQVRIPFTFSIDHQLKRRAASDSIVLAVHSEQGLIGYGEGAPRNYVTGENTSEVVKTFYREIVLMPQLSIQQWEDVQFWLREFDERVQSPALSCAMEMALLDLYGQAKGMSVADILSPNGERYFPIYSAVLPFLPLDQLEKWLLRMKGIGIKHYKLKVGQADDRRMLSIVRDILGPEADIRLDANRAWTLAEARRNIETLSAYNISCVEEPLLATEIEKLIELGKETPIKILLDESVFSLEHVQYYIDHLPAESLMFNLKISKSGGLRATSKLHQLASLHGIDCQLGCNVGETALLTAAGRIFAQTHRLSYLEGSLGGFFMEGDLTEEFLGFGQEGVATPLYGPGLGVDIIPSNLEKYSIIIQ